MLSIRSSVVAAAFLLAAGNAPCQQPAPPPQDVNPPVMKINGQPVYAAEISLIMNTMVRQLEQGGSEYKIEDVVIVHR